MLQKISWMLAVFLGSCKTASPSALTHDTDQPSGSKSPYFWVDQKAEDFRAYTLKSTFPQYANDTFYPDSNPLIQRLQQWADRLNARLKETYPGVIDHIPSPRIRLLNSAGKNAVVLKAPQCFQNVLWSPSDSPEPSRVQDGQRFEISQRGLQTVGAGIPCQRTAATFEQLLAFTDNVNAFSGGCKLRVSQIDPGNFALHFDAGCDTSELSDAKDKTFALVVFPIARDVVLLRGLVENATEDDVVSTLYHELGHYYKAHSLSLRTINYLYWPKPSNPSHAPASDTKLKPLREKYESAQYQFASSLRKVDRLQSSLKPDIYRKFPTQVLHGALRDALFNSVSHTATHTCAGQSSDVCSRCNASLAAVKADLFKDFPWGITPDLSQDLVDAYLKFEGEAALCLKDFALTTDADEAMSPAKLALGTLDPMVRQSLPFKMELGEVAPSAHVWDYFLKASQNLEARYGFQEESYKDYLQSLPLKAAHYTRAIEAQDQMRSLEDQFTILDLGFFSSEQEADELAAEWLNLMAFPASAAGSSFFNLMDEKTKKDCAARRAKAWLNDKGNPVTLRWGAYPEPHPNTCFRVRDSDMEAIAHGYTLTGPSPAQALTPSWDELKTSLKAKPERAARSPLLIDPASLSFGAHVFRKSYGTMGLNCIFSEP